MAVICDTFSVDATFEAMRASHCKLKNVTTVGVLLFLQMLRDDETGESQSHNNVILRRVNNRLRPTCRALGRK